jgi:cytochrome c biogenesis protein
VRQNGKVLYDGPTVFLSQKGAWHGVVKLPSAKPNQVGLDMLFFADPVVRNGSPFDQSPRPNHPVIVFQQYEGDLALDVPQSVYELNTTDMHRGQSGVIPLGQTVSLPNGVQVTFRDLRQYSVFQVNTNPGAPILLIAAVLILVGLLPALYSSRRRVWVRAAPDGGTVRLEIAGHALQRKAAFEEEFESLVRDLEQDLQRTSR